MWKMRSKAKQGILWNETAGTVLGVIVVVVSLVVFAGWTSVYFGGSIEDTSRSSFERIASEALDLVNSGADGKRVVSFLQVRKPWGIYKFEKGDFPCRDANCICICTPKTCAKQDARESERLCVEFPPVEAIVFNGFEGDMLLDNVYIELSGTTLYIADAPIQVQPPSTPGSVVPSQPAASLPANVDVTALSQKTGVEPGILSIALKYAVENNLEPALVLAAIEQESGFNPLASNSGSRGLMQVRDVAAKEVFRTNPDLAVKYGGSKTSIGTFDPFNAEQNAEVGVRYLKDIFEGWSMIADPEQRLKFTFGSYASGPPTVVIASDEAAKTNSFSRYNWDVVVNYIEPSSTRDQALKHVPSVMTRYQKFKKDIVGVSSLPPTQANEQNVGNPGVAEQRSTIINVDG